MAEELEVTVERIRALIKQGSGRLPPERALAEDLGVGRRAVRRALDLLEQEGHIQRRQGAGTFVASEEDHDGDPFSRAIQMTNPVEVLEVRLAIEPTLTRLAAVRASRTDMDKLTKLAESTEATTTAKAYEQADAAFHRHIALIARNALFLSVFDAVVAAIENVSWHGLRETAHCSKNKAIYASFHRDIAAAIARRDASRAEALMFAHLKHVQEHLLAATQPQLGTSGQSAEAA
jgi:DNA-binding FadR family transcriptional regulator